MQRSLDGAEAVVVNVRLVALALLAVAACAPSRDVVPESHDVRGVDAPDAASQRTDGYAYVARRPHGAVGLVGAHFVAIGDAQKLVDRVADDLETCATRLEGAGTLVEGAVQLVAVQGARANADISDIRFAPGGAVAANALECIVAPLRASPFPSGTDAGLPAVAIEATWTPRRRLDVDAGGTR